jgi:formylglycine-generating enzyme required for sulfatase activity
VTQYSNGVSPYGCYDMMGNVREWCSSEYDESIGRRVVRGGSWDDSPVDLRTLGSSWTMPDVRLNNRGFRLVQDFP